MSHIEPQKTPIKDFYKPLPISGFPEWTPEIRDVEKKWIKTIEETFERYGFVNIETPAVEEIPVLISKGEDADKEIYALHRLAEAKDGSESTSGKSKLALHYDLTVPMARYVAQHYDKLTFPFKRYQMQKVWRGDRPQKGRYREFMQCDIDVVDRNAVSLEFDAEFPLIISNLVRKLDIGDVTIGINNRKILQGFYQGLGLDDEQIVQVIRAVDKIDKIGADGVASTLSEHVGIDNEVIGKCLALSEFRRESVGITDKVMALGVDTPLLREGLYELDFVMARLAKLPPGSAVADLSIARGFDYYTGTVYEGKFTDYPEYSTILAGGRYDNLVSDFSRESLPGVGISLGLTRIFAKMLDEKKIQAGRKTPTQALVTLADENARDLARDVADGLRERGICTEMYHKPVKLADQLKYADKKNIPYVIFPSNDDDQHQVKDMRTGTQSAVSLKIWKPE